jgi:hypothetical protein
MHLEFFYAGSREAVQRQVEAFLTEKRASSGAEVYQELLVPCEQGAVVARQFLPGAITLRGEEATRVEFHWRRRLTLDMLC